MSPHPATALETTDPRELRRTLGAFATGVTVVTTGGDVPHGMTANSFTSVSVDPPLVLVCVGHTAVMHRRLAIGTFGVSVLGRAQREVARHFADLSRPMGAAQFQGLDCEPGRVTGLPLISGALARLECELWNSHEAGDHTIFIGRVLSMDRPDPDQQALLFHRGRFSAVEDDQSEAGS